PSVHTLSLHDALPIFWKKTEDRELAGFLTEHPPRFPLNLAAAAPLTTDDWPYIYQRGRTIPRVYLAVSLILLTLAILLVRKKFQDRKSTRLNSSHVSI